MKREVAIADTIVRSVYVAVECQNQRERVLRNGIGRVRRHAHDLDAQPLRRSDVDVVESRTAQGNTFCAGVRKLCEHGLIDDIVDKDADNVGVLREVYGLLIQPHVEGGELVAVVDIC
jgi:hypothetical protein